MKQKLLFLFISILVLSVSCKTTKQSGSSNSNAADNKGATETSVQAKSQNATATVNSTSQQQAATKSKTSANAVDNSSFKIMEKTPNLKNLSELSAFFDMLDISYYPDLVNDPVNAHKYIGNEKKTAANLGAYLGDMVYVMGSEGYIEAYKNFGAAMELANEMDIEKEFPNLVIDRYEGKMPTDSIMLLLDEALNKSEKDLSEKDKVIFYDFMLYGNYIEKLHVISGLLVRVNKSKLPDVAIADLKRNLLIFMAKQRKPLEKAYAIMTPYFNNTPEIINEGELKHLIALYKDLEANKDAILKLDPKEIYNAKEVLAIGKQIEVVRNRIVN